ncbi:MAG: ACT domain-containing protein, partial [Limisphaerales bacterium]
VLPIERCFSEYFVRLHVVDRPGVLAKIATILGESQIGISSVIQPEGHEGRSVPLIFMLHRAPNGAAIRALKKISRLPAIKGRPVMLRVEDFEK